MLGGTADVEGYLKITGVPVGRQTFQVKAIGYEAQMIPNVVITAGKEVLLDVVLTESVMQQTEAEIMGRRSENKRLTNNEMALISGRSFNVDETKRYAGA